MFHSVTNSSPTPLWSWKMSVVRSFEDLCLLHMGESLDESLPAKLVFFACYYAMLNEISMLIDVTSCGNSNNNNSSSTKSLFISDYQNSRCRNNKVTSASPPVRKLRKRSSYFVWVKLAAC